MGLYDKLGSGMSANQLWMNISANNVTNMNTTRTETGGPYQRQSVVFQEKTAFDSYFQQEIGGGVQVTEVRQDDSFRTAYEPDHPDADEQGYVKYPAINLTAEMANIIMAKQGYQASVTVFNEVRQIGSKTLEIGKG